MNKILAIITCVTVLAGCASNPWLKDNEAALYSSIESREVPLPIAYEYAVVYKVGGKGVSFDEDPVILKAGRRSIVVKIGRCIAPVLIIACDFQPRTYMKIDYEFKAGSRYRLTNDGSIVQI